MPQPETWQIRLLQQSERLKQYARNYVNIEQAFRGVDDRKDVETSIARVLLRQAEGVVLQGVYDAIGDQYYTSIEETSHNSIVIGFGTEIGCIDTRVHINF